MDDTTFTPPQVPGFVPVDTTSAPGGTTQPDTTQAAPEAPTQPETTQAAESQTSPTALEKEAQAVIDTFELLINGMEKIPAIIGAQQIQAARRLRGEINTSLINYLYPPKRPGE